MIDNIEKFYGVTAAFYSFYDDNGNISVERTKNAARWLVKKGIDGLYLTGSSGEGMLQSVEERQLIYKTVMEEVGGEVSVIAHVAANNTADSVKLAKYAADCGVDGISAVPGIYYNLPDKCVEEYWDAMIQAAKKPFFIYNIPKNTGNVSLSLFDRMIHKDYVAGIKTTSVDPTMLLSLREISDNKAVIFYGEDGQLLAGLCMGATGGIGGTYAAMPELYVKLYQAFKKGDLKEALLWQERARKAFMHGRVSWTSGIAGMKAIMEARGVPIGGVRSPFLKVDKNEKVVREVAEMIEGWLAE